MDSGESEVKMDEVPTIKNVVFIGEYFSLITTVNLYNFLREGDESDDEFAIRIASNLLVAEYGWDVAGASIEIGVSDE
jgi:hypothetical protein